MNKFSISEAIKLSGISRSNFYKKYLNTGEISFILEDGKKLIELSELLRVFPNSKLKTQEKEQSETIEDASKDKLIAVLEQQIKEAKERESWLKNQVDELRYQQTNLLEDKTKKRKKILGIF